MADPSAHLLAGISGGVQVQQRGGHSPVWPAAPPAAAAATSRGGPPAAATRCGTCVWLAGRRQLGRCRTLACWHRWGCASAAEGWAQPRLACCTTGSGGGDEPRQPAGGGEAVRCGTCVWLAGRSWAGVAHLLAGISGGVQVQQRGGHSPVWPAAPHRGSGGGDEPRRPAGGGEAVRHVCVAGRAQAAGQVSHTCLLASVGVCKCRRGVGTAPSGLLHHRQRRRRRAAAARRRRRGGAVRHVCVAGRAQLGRCRTLACWHQWGCASAAEGWAQPRLGLLHHRQRRRRRAAAARRRWRGGAARVCGWQGAGSWAGVAHLLAGIGGGVQVQQRGGHSPVWPATAFVTKTVTWLCLANSKHSWACVGARVNAARAVARKDGCRHAVAMAVLGVMRGVMRREQERGAESKQQVTASFVAIEKLGQAPAFGICRTIRLCSDRCPSAATPCPCKWCGQMGSEDVSATQIQRAPHGQMNAIGGLQGTCAAELNSGVPTQTLASSKPPPSPTYAHCPTLASSHPPPPLPYPHPHPTELTTRGASPRRPRAAAAACRCRQARSYGRRCAPPSVAPAAQDHHTAW